MQHTLFWSGERVEAGSGWLDLNFNAIILIEMGCSEESHIFQRDSSFIATIATARILSCGFLLQ